MSVRIITGDCREVLATLPDASVHSIVTDPPYGLGFMGKAWDHAVPGVEFWTAMLRVAKPGAHLLAFGGTRTFHRMACAIEDAGWELRDTLMWLYGSGFPKSLNVSKAIDKAAGAKREVAGRHERVDRITGIAGNDGRCITCGRGRGGQPGNCQCDKIGEPITDAAREWGGWGTALKPAYEPIIMARKPFSGTVADNVIRHGTAALNIDGCRVEGASVPQPVYGVKSDGVTNFGAGIGRNGEMSQASGRWPANVLHDGSDEVLAAFPDAIGQIADASTSSRATQNVYGGMRRGNGRDGEPSADSANDGVVGFQMRPGARRGDAGSAARFFYCAKASREDRNVGMQGEPEKPLNWSSGAQSPGTFQSENTHRAAANHHPTVKPTELMRWLVRLVTPPGGAVLDPFLGSGSTARACDIEGFDCIGIEIDPAYAAIARKRISGDAPLFAQVGT